MAIDYAALLGNAAGVQAAKATYDFARDGGALYARPIGSVTIPQDSVLVAVVALCTTALTFGGSGALYIQVDGVTVLTVPVNLGEVAAGWLPANPGFVTTAARSVEAYVSGAAILTGAATIWLLYLPL